MTQQYRSKSKTRNVNNFQNLYDRENTFEKNNPRIKRDIWKTLSVFKFIGQIVDAYVPKVVDLFVAASGGRTSEPDTHQKGTAPGIDPNTKGPRDPAGWTDKGSGKNNNL